VPIQPIEVGFLAQLVLQHTADVHLVDEARRDPLAHLRHSRDVCRLVE
jgi:hypothetical protein